jgi:predicted nucleic acid-binding protein
MKLFLDTNVYIDFLLVRKPFDREAISIISRAADGNVDVAISAITAVTADYICVERCKMPRQLMTMKAIGLKDVVNVLSVDSCDVWDAYIYKWNDMEDGVQHYCALRNGCDYIVTRNPKDFVNSEIPVISPARALELIDGLL